MNLLLVDDDEVLLKALRRSLEALGYGIDTCTDGNAALDAVASQNPDLVVLDVMLPGKDGFTVLRGIRERYPELPVIMLTARSEDIDKVLGLEMGADDYLSKPFNVRELAARVKAVARRVSGEAGTSGPAGATGTSGMAGVTGGPGAAGTPGGLASRRSQIRHRDFLLDLGGYRLWKGGREISLTAREFDVLALMLRNLGVVFTREKLLEACWGFDYLGDSRAVDVLISRLREKIENDPQNPAVIRTRRGVGYYCE